MANRTLVTGQTEWPLSLTPRNITVTMDRPVFTGPKPLAGREQVVSHSSGGWKISYEDIPIHVGSSGYNYDPASQVAPFKTVKQIMLLMAYDQSWIISPIIGPLSIKNRYNLGTTNPTDCFLTRDHTRGDTTIYFANSTIAPLKNGDYFELNGRLHIVLYTGIGTGNIVSSKNELTSQIWPPLRSNYSANQLLEIADPRCTCYADVNSRANSLTMQMGMNGSWNIDFTEASW